MSQQLVKIFKALSDQTRLDIVKHLLRLKHECSCQDMQELFPLSQPTLSHHFNKLIDAQILKVRKHGASHYYAIDSAYLKTIGINITRLSNTV